MTDLFHTMADFYLYSSRPNTYGMFIKTNFDRILNDGLLTRLGQECFCLVDTSQYSFVAVFQ